MYPTPPPSCVDVWCEKQWQRLKGRIGALPACVLLLFGVWWAVYGVSCLADMKLWRDALCHCATGCPGSDCASNYMGRGEFEWGVYDAGSNLLWSGKAGECNNITNATFARVWHALDWHGKGVLTGDWYRADCGGLWFRIREVCGSVTNLGGIPTAPYGVQPSWESFGGELGAITDAGSTNYYQRFYHCISSTSFGSLVITGTWGRVMGVGGEVLLAYDGTQWGAIWRKYNDHKWAVKFAGDKYRLPSASDWVVYSVTNQVGGYTQYNNCEDCINPYCEWCLEGSEKDCCYSEPDVYDEDGAFVSFGMSHACNCDWVPGTNYVTNYAYRWEFDRH